LKEQRPSFIKNKVFFFLKKKYEKISFALEVLNYICLVLIILYFLCFNPKFYFCHVHSLDVVEGKIKLLRKGDKRESYLLIIKIAELVVNGFVLKRKIQ
jgi:hypothetical protein